MSFLYSTSGLIKFLKKKVWEKCSYGVLTMLKVIFYCFPRNISFVEFDLNIVKKNVFIYSHFGSMSVYVVTLEIFIYGRELGGGYQY